MRAGRGCSRRYGTYVAACYWRCPLLPHAALATLLAAVLVVAEPAAAHYELRWRDLPPEAGTATWILALTEVG